MEQLNALKQAEGRLSIVADKIIAYGAKLEDFVFRAQRIASAIKNKQKVSDSMFGYELQNFRRELRHFSQDVESLPAILTSIEMSARYEEASFRAAESVSRVSQRIHKGLSNLHDHALLAHSHIREADYKIEAWYLCQELEDMAHKAQALPGHANKIVIAVTSPSKTEPPAPAAPPPQG